MGDHYLVAGKRMTLHRLPTQESCNVDVAFWRRRFVLYGQAVKASTRLCRHCFPRRGR